MVDRKRPQIRFWLAPLIFGLLGISRLMQSPRFDAYRTIDVVLLLGSGMWIGAVLFGVISTLRRSKRNDSS